MSELVLVVPLKEGAFEDALALLRGGPPFDLDETEFERHRVYATTEEIVFVFESPNPAATLALRAEDPSPLRLGREWETVMASGPRKAETAFSWSRGEDGEGFSYGPTPGPGDSEGGDIYRP